MLKSLRKVCGLSRAFPGGAGSKDPTNTGDIRDVGSIPGSGRSPGMEMATYSSILAWRITWTEEPSGMQYVGSPRVGHY